MIDNNIHFNCNIAKTESGFSMSDLSFKSITQTDKKKHRNFRTDKKLQTNTMARSKHFRIRV